MSSKDIISAIESKIEKRDEDFRVYTYDNSYLLEISGRNSEDEWATSKVCIVSIEELNQVIEHVLKNIPVNS